MRYQCSDLLNHKQLQKVKIMSVLRRNLLGVVRCDHRIPESIMRSFSFLCIFKTCIKISTYLSTIHSSIHMALSISAETIWIYQQLGYNL